MSDEAMAIIGLIAALVLGLFFGFAFGVVHAHKDAVMNGAAKYVHSELEYHPQFVWINGKEAK